MTNKTNIKTLIKRFALGMFASGLAISASAVNAQEHATSSQGATAVISTGAVSPSTYQLNEKRIAASPKYRLEQNDLGEFALSPKAEKNEAFMLKPMFNPKYGHDTSAVTFSSLDQFLVSLTEQNRLNQPTYVDLLATTQDTQLGTLPTPSRANLLNSRFANLVIKGLTGSK